MKFSIIITCYNRQKFILRCIKSALNQAGIDRSAYEVVVVNDCSTDKSKEVISQFESSIRIIQNKKNLGLSESRNLGIKKSKGKYLLMLDSDDYISEHYLHFVGSFFDFNKTWTAVACDYTKINYRGKFLRVFYFRLFLASYTWNLSFPYVLEGEDARAKESNTALRRVCTATKVDTCAQRL